MIIRYDRLRNRGMTEFQITRLKAAGLLVPGPHVGTLRTTSPPSSWPKAHRDAWPK